MQVLPSDYIESFLEFFKDSKEEYEQNIQEVWKHDKKKQDQLHDMEFADNYKERCKIATRIHNERVQRRQYKDRAEITKEIAAFYSDKKNKPFFDGLKSLLEKQKSTEQYLMHERHYNRRGGDVE